MTDLCVITPSSLFGTLITLHHVEETPTIYGPLEDLSSIGHWTTRGEVRITRAEDGRMRVEWPEGRVLADRIEDRRQTTEAQTRILVVEDDNE